MMCHDMMFSCKAHTKLGGGFCELMQFDFRIFLKWVVQPPTRKHIETTHATLVGGLMTLNDFTIMC